MQGVVRVQHDARPAKSHVVFETHPFISCPMCKAASAFGVLHISSSHLSQRCKICKFTENRLLPALNKKVVYLDQFAISNIYKIRSGEALKPPHVHDYWVEFENRVTRAQLSQAVIFPPSDIHRNETTVSAFPSELRIAHEMFGGGAFFVNSETLKARQEIDFAKAYLNGESAPDLEFNVDGALRGSRNGWLPHLHVTVNTTLSSIAEELRQSRHRLHDAMLPLFDRWQKEKPAFDVVLKEELAAFGRSRIEISLLTLQKYASAMDRQDIDEIWSISTSDSMRHLIAMTRVFRDHGVLEQDCLQKVLEFWSWAELEKLPFHRISSYLFAEIAARLAAGQKRKPTQGMHYDVSAISSYAPYVDAMFVDLECANLLGSARLKSALRYRAQIFSKATTEEFFNYLERLEAEVSHDVKQWTGFLYGLRPSK